MTTLLEILSTLARDFQRAKTREQGETLILRAARMAIQDTTGGAFIRYIPSIGMIYVSCAYGIYEKVLHQYKPADYGLSGYILKNHTPVIVNSSEDLPSSVYGNIRDNYLPGEAFMGLPVPPTDENSLGVIILAKRYNIFTETEMRNLYTIATQGGIFLKRLVNEILLRRLKATHEEGARLLRDSMGKEIDTAELITEYLKLGIDLIDAAQKGSALMETDGGFQFIAVHGYPKVLLHMDPIPFSQHLRWYHLSEDELRAGKPRIITEEVISEVAKVDPVAKVSSSLHHMKANLVVPVVVQGKVLLFVNLDNFDTAVAFDETDIEVAKELSTYMASALFIQKQKETIRLEENLLEHIMNLSETLTRPKETVKNLKPKDAFVWVLREGVKSLNPMYVFVRCGGEIGYTMIHPFYDVPASYWEREIEDILGELAKTGREHIRFKRGNYQVMFASVPMDEGGPVDVIVIKEGLTPWTDADMKHLISVINYAMLYTKNIVALTQKEKTHEDTMRLLGKALELRDLETGGHIERTSALTKALAELIDFEDIKAITWGAYVHDIGKITIPDSILLKPDKLTPEEFEIVKEHVNRGVDIIKGIHGLSPITINVVKYHHERWDGSGYPEGLSGEDIPLEARIFAVVDVFDALISRRPYKEPWPLEKAIEEIKRGSAKLFDPSVVDAFLYLVGSGKLPQIIDLQGDRDQVPKPR